MFARKTFTLKKKCYGGKHSKERLTILLAGRLRKDYSSRHRKICKNSVFQGINSFITKYRSNKKAWMTTELFTECCFKKSGFPSPNLVNVDDTLTEFNAEPSLWEALPEQDLTFDDFVLVDTDTAVWGALSDAEIVALHHNNTESDEDD
ncbi:uncharacterized protein TNCV_4731191 [Trichonephila clavipes]|nr:uncharacterized protein TNCV_4731191 [Trichonephila clavipes]